MLHLRHFVMKEEALLKLNKTRQHSSRMRTACLPTVCVLVAVVVLNETNRWSDFRSHLLRCRPHARRPPAPMKQMLLYLPSKTKCGSQRKFKSKVDNDK